MTTDHYAGAAGGWASGASLVYRPIAELLVGFSPRPLAGRVVLDAGAGTGVASAALMARGARPLAVDLSLGMLAWLSANRPPGTVADIRALPIAGGAVDDALAAFVLNHLVDPKAGLAELARVTKPGGTVLATVYSNANHSDARDALDAEAGRCGWRAPDWYLRFKEDAAPLLGSADLMGKAAANAGLTDIAVDERAVDVGVLEPEQLVRFRFGQAHFSGWITAMDAGHRERVRRQVVDAVRPVMEPYRPVVVFLAARR